ncbi:hypothetical protein OHB41_01970 [Streptomyces sp. NBC_01571]|uniref:alcohol dehydrogenase catalytic domain-containing protein n=1 Tax=Streptomyces sp. NBC_01571 TaxID=2975883 RepID=UPI00224FCAE3|nr:hypothetical protein [Streptomyces sp. NBC_01571]MCX4571971.1 hypothetical protein [Streptomyces sp. NBC_01571]
MLRAAEALSNGYIDQMLAGRLTPPYRPGMDAAGVVDEIGPGTVTDLRAGDRVMAIVIPIDPPAAPTRSTSSSTPDRSSGHRPGPHTPRRPLFR